MRFRRAAALCIVLTAFLAAGRGHAAPGSPDREFGNGEGSTAYVSFGSEDQPTEVFSQGAKIVVVGTTGHNQGPDVAIARLDRSGRPDKTFSRDGRLTFRPGFAHETTGRSGGLTVGAAPAPGGSIFIGMTRALFSGGRCCVYGAKIAKVTPGGSLDRTFGSGGIADVPIADHPAGLVLTSVLPGPDGSVVAGGFVRALSPPGADRFAVLRVNAAGALDPSFGTGGVILGPELGSSAVRTLARGAGNSIVAGGTSHLAVSVEPAAALLLIRITERGTLDHTFGTGGITRIAFSSGDAVATGLVVASDGAVTAAGTAIHPARKFSRVVLARVKADGSPDVRFSGDGKAAPLSRESAATSIASRPRGAYAIGVGPEACSTSMCHPTASAVIGVDRFGRLQRSFASGFAALPGSFSQPRVAKLGTNIVVAAAGVRPRSPCPPGRVCFYVRGIQEVDFAVAKLTG